MAASTRIALILVLATLLVAVPAIGQQGYGDPGGDAQTEITELPPVTPTPPNSQSATSPTPASSGGSSAPQATAAGGLARTGSDLEPLAAMGAGLLLSGAGLRLLTRSRIT
jgi:hypothetical protein